MSSLLFPIITLIYIYKYISGLVLVYGILCLVETSLSLVPKVSVEFIQGEGQGILRHSVSAQ